MADLDRDLYEVLGILPSASAAEVTSAYRRRVRALHPDSGEGATTDPTGLSEVLAAFQVLRDPEQRAAYDAHGRRRPSDQPCVGAVRISAHRPRGAVIAERMATRRPGPCRPRAAPGLPTCPFTGSPVHFLPRPLPADRRTVPALAVGAPLDRAGSPTAATRRRRAAMLGG